jgi:hypothetical protein
MGRIVLLTRFGSANQWPAADFCSVWLWRLTHARVCTPQTGTAPDWLRLVRIENCWY